MKNKQQTLEQTNISNEINHEKIKISDADKSNIDVARLKKLLYTAEARAAILQNEKIDIEYKYLILQMYMKYGLTNDDAISENGDIVKNALKKSE